MRVDFQAVTLVASTREVGRVESTKRSKGTCDATGEYERENVYRNGYEQWDWERDGAWPR